MAKRDRENSPKAKQLVPNTALAAAADLHESAGSHTAPSVFTLPSPRAAQSKREHRWQMRVANPSPWLQIQKDRDVWAHGPSPPLPSQDREEQILAPFPGKENEA